MRMESEGRFYIITFQFQYYRIVITTSSNHHAHRLLLYIIQRIHCLFGKVLSLSQYLFLTAAHHSHIECQPRQTEHGSRGRIFSYKQRIKFATQPVAL